MAVMIEKPSRRSTLAFYVSNVASEALFRIYVGRRFIKPIPYGQVYLFTVSIATIMYLAKKNGFENDPLSAMISTIVGPEEAAQSKRSSRTKLDENNSSKVDYKESFKLTTTAQATQFKFNLSQFLQNLKLILTSKHKLCPHNENISCLKYSLIGAARALLLGYCGQFGLRLVTRLPAKIYSSQDKVTVFGIGQQILSLATESGVLKFGVFISAFSALFKLTNCVLRRFTNESSARNCFIAGLLAGQTFFLHPSPTMALYVVWKCLEILFHESARKNALLSRHKDKLIVLLYGLSTSQLFYSAILDPGHIKQSYLAFLDRMSRHRLHWINRNILDVFGTQASLGYEDFFPDLHPKFLSNQFLGSIWLWLIEQRFSASQLTW